MLRIYPQLISLLLQTLSVFFLHCNSVIIVTQNQLCYSHNAIFLLRGHRCFSLSLTVFSLNSLSLIIKQNPRAMILSKKSSSDYSLRKRTVSFLIILTFFTKRAAPLSTYYSFFPIEGSFLEKNSLGTLKSSEVRLLSAPLRKVKKLLQPIQK